MRVFVRSETLILDVLRKCYMNTRESFRGFEKRSNTGLKVNFKVSQFQKHKSQIASIWSRVSGLSEVTRIIKTISGIKGRSCFDLSSNAPVLYSRSPEDYVLK